MKRNLQRKSSSTIAREARSVADVAVVSSSISVVPSSIIAAAIFVAAHLALMIGLTTPQSFVFDEVHYVPAARQMLEPVMP
ncbi:MAG TPA: hypothetical protein VGZ92_09215, partial [Bradyrhizobium sp.]|nr:hypothetical protein [Bradyrhizobium sp.]